MACSIPGLRERVVESKAAIRGLLDRCGMRSVVETGARFLLDPRRKHEPTLMSPDPAERRRRIEFLCRAIDTGAIWRAIAFRSGRARSREALDEDAAFQRLIEGLAEVCDYARQHGVLIGFEPEPGMFVDRLVQFEKLLGRFDSPAPPLDDRHRPSALPGRIANRRADSPLVRSARQRAYRRYCAGVHEHLMFGEGEIDFPPVLAALAESDYAGLVQVEAQSAQPHGAAGSASGRWSSGAADAPGRDDKKTARG